MEPDQAAETVVHHEQDALPPRAALRLQVAAVAAQQAALFDEETRLQLQQDALTQQQEQLGAHLEDRRQHLLQQGEQIQTARAALKQERQEHTLAAARQTETLASGLIEIDDSRKKLRAARQRVQLLRRRLKRHFDRRLAAAEKQIRHREVAVSDQHHRLEKEAEKLLKQQQTLTRERLSLNAEVEIAKRQLLEERQEFRHEQRRFKEESANKQSELAVQAAALRQRQDILAHTERDVADDRHAWEQKRKLAEHEVQGLESRIVNLRHKLAEQTRELDQVPAQQQDDVEAYPVGIVEEPPVYTGVPHDPQHTRTVEIEQLAEDLADQRLELVEQWQNLAMAQQDWQQARTTAANDLQAATRGLEEREQALVAAQAAVAAEERATRQRRQELASFRQDLEAWASRLTLRESAWESERDCLFADLRDREEVAEKHLAALAPLRQTWATRRRQELDTLQSDRAACEILRQEYAALRQECWKRTVALDQHQRDLTEKALALEEFRQRMVLRSQDAAAVESRLERMRRRWTQHNALAMRSTEEQFALLHDESAQVQKRGQQLLRIAEELTTREVELAERQTATEEAQALADARQEALRQELETAKAQRERCERQVTELQAEVERLARVLLDEADQPAMNLSRAA